MPNRCTGSRLDNCLNALANRCQPHRWRSAAHQERTAVAGCSPSPAAVLQGVLGRPAAPAKAACGQDPVPADACALQGHAAAQGCGEWGAIQLTLSVHASTRLRTPSAKTGGAGRCSRAAGSRADIWQREHPAPQVRMTSLSGLIRPRKQEELITVRAHAGSAQARAGTPAAAC
jgi:hypothetical protein